MGISGLLPLLKSIQRPCNLKKFSGQAIGVDAYGWLHRGTVSCAIELAQGKPTTKFVDFAMHRVRMLLHFNIKPYIVFDGDYLPSKAHTESERHSRRQEAKKLGLELLDLGKTSQAQLELQKAVDVTPEMARQLIEELKKAGVNYVVAPYEADAQLVYLEKKGLIQGIISEDSDMLVFGAKCLITKLDQYGECIAVHRREFAACREISLVSWTDADFRRMAILSGCDYLPSINNMGLKTAYRLLRKYKTVERLVKQLQFDGKWKIPQGYLESFKKAESTFLYQWVWCPENRRLTNLTEPTQDVDIAGLEYIGAFIDPDVAGQVANGDLHPHTKEIIDLDPGLLRNSKWHAARPKQPVPTTPMDDLKKNKSIDTFFKPKRVPLAELDPNLFTPSPSQERLLEQEQQTWTATPAPPRSVTGPRPIASSGVARAPTGRTFSAPNPSKRQRLCSDESPLGAMTSSTRVMSGPSRFFSSPELNSTPSTRARGSRSKKLQSDFQLWSDDSIEEAMADLTETAVSTSQKSRKLSVFRDDSGYVSASNATSQEKPKATEARSSRTRLRQTASESSVSADSDMAQSKLWSRPSAVTVTAGSPAAQDRREDPSEQLTEGTEHVPASPAPPQQSHDRDKDPDATLCIDSPVPESEISPTKSELDGSTLLEAEAPQSLLKVAPKTRLCDDFSSPLKGAMKPTRAPRRNAVPTGSEDMLVPDSEADSEFEIPSPVALKMEVKEKLDLRRFAFEGS
ncbi:MAG: Rad2 nuclease [Bogoriella megaspora]|nr:MAG: Rad2 nuclease [Bogoriella megaspora]